MLDFPCLSSWVTANFVLCSSFRLFGGKEILRAEILRMKYGVPFEDEFNGELRGQVCCEGKTKKKNRRRFNHIKAAFGLLREREKAPPTHLSKASQYWVGTESLLICL